MKLQWLNCGVQTQEIIKRSVENRVFRSRIMLLEKIRYIFGTQKLDDFLTTCTRIFWKDIRCLLNLVFPKVIWTLPLSPYHKSISEDTILMLRMKTYDCYLQYFNKQLETWRCEPALSGQAHRNLPQLWKGCPGFWILFMKFIRQLLTCWRQLATNTVSSNFSGHFQDPCSPFLGSFQAQEAMLQGVEKRHILHQDAMAFLFPRTLY